MKLVILLRERRLVLGVHVNGAVYKGLVLFACLIKTKTVKRGPKTHCKTDLVLVR